MATLPLSPKSVAQQHTRCARKRRLEKMGCNASRRTDVLRSHLPPQSGALHAHNTLTRNTFLLCTQRLARNIVKNVEPHLKPFHSSREHPTPCQYCHPGRSSCSEHNIGTNISRQSARIPSGTHIAAVHLVARIVLKIAPQILISTRCQTARTSLGFLTILGPPQSRHAPRRKFGKWRQPPHAPMMVNEINLPARAETFLQPQMVVDVKWMRQTPCSPEHPTSPHWRC